MRAKLLSPTCIVVCCLMMLRRCKSICTHMPTMSMACRVAVLRTIDTVAERLLVVYALSLQHQENKEGNGRKSRRRRRRHPARRQPRGDARRAIAPKKARRAGRTKPNGKHEKRPLWAVFSCFRSEEKNVAKCPFLRPLECFCLQKRRKKAHFAVSKQGKDAAEGEAALRRQTLDGFLRDERNVFFLDRAAASRGSAKQKAAGWDAESLPRRR